MAEGQAGDTAPAPPAVSAFSTPPPEMSREEILHEGQQGLRDFCIVISFLLLVFAGVMAAVNNGVPNPGAGIAIAGVGFYVLSRVGK
jgi:hypothetical protein